MRWQDIKGFFKKRSRSRTLWVTGGVTFAGVIAMVLLLTGVSVEYTGDIVCAEECVSYINVTSTYWRICFGSDFELIQTDPHIRVDVFVPTYGGKWRPFSPINDCIERKNKYRPLPNRFKIVGYKFASETVKWGAAKFDVDPLWIGVESLKDKCIEYDMVPKNKLYVSSYQTVVNISGSFSVPVYTLNTTPIEVCVKKGQFLSTSKENISADEKNIICWDDVCRSKLDLDTTCTIKNDEFVCEGYEREVKRLMGK